MSLPASVKGSPTLDKYELLDEIGCGGMATVYRAKDKRLGREVAVKVIHKHLRDNAEVGRRFVAEARASAKLRHPGIVDVYDVSDEDDPERYLVVELMRGTTLRRVLEKHRSMPPEVGASIVIELCEALSHAHASGIIHRDVKPENVLVELPQDRQNDEVPAAKCGPSSHPGKGRVVVKLTDFGIAKVLDAQGVTSTGQVLGSPAHMAPEQIEAGDVDERTDVFALGVLLYEALVGHLPFEGKNPAQVLRRVLEGSYSPAERERPELGSRWARIIDGALRHDIHERFADPSVLATHIREELGALQISDPAEEISAFFADPAAYEEAHPKRLVPILVARGEAAKKRGDVVGAAADYNRALALSPGDMALLKKVTSLRATASRGRQLRRTLFIAAPTIALGLAAYGVARLVRSTEPVRTLETTKVLATPPVLASAEPQASAVPEPPMGPPVAETPERVEPTHLKPKPGMVAKIPIATRNVQFVIAPQGATLTLDGNEVKWFGRTIPLSPGAHTAFVEMRGSRCCKTQTKGFQVDALTEDQKNEAQTVFVRLEMNESTVRLGGTTPAGAQYACQGIGLSGFAGETRKVVLTEAMWTGPCSFTSAERKGAVSDFVTLRAGEPNVVPWPSGG